MKASHQLRQNAPYTKFLNDERGFIHLMLYRFTIGSKQIIKEYLEN